MWNHGPRGYRHWRIFTIGNEAKTLLCPGRVLLFGIFLMCSPKQSKPCIILCVVIGWVIPAFLITILYGICITKLNKKPVQNDNVDGMQRRHLENKIVVKTLFVVGELFVVGALPLAISMCARVQNGSGFHSLPTPF